MLTFFKIEDSFHPALSISKITRDEFLAFPIPKRSTLTLRIHGATERDVLAYATAFELSDGVTQAFPKPIGPVVIPRSFVFQIVPEAEDRAAGAPPSTGQTLPNTQAACATLFNRWQSAAAMNQNPAVVNRLKRLYEECGGLLASAQSSPYVLPSSPGSAYASPMSLHDAFRIGQKDPILFALYNRFATEVAAKAMRMIPLAELYHIYGRHRFYHYGLRTPPNLPLVVGARARCATPGYHVHSGGGCVLRETADRALSGVVIPNGSIVQVLMRYPDFSFVAGPDPQPDGSVVTRFGYVPNDELPINVIPGT